MKKILSGLFIVLLMFVCLTFTVKAANSDVYNIVTCPGEDMSTQMQINWHSPTSYTAFQVQYTEATDTTFANAKSVDGTSKVFSRESDSKAQYTGFSTPRHVWTAELDGLTPNTNYIYRIVNGTTVYSDNYAFKTASGTDEEFSFLFMTDPQYYNESGASRFNKMTEDHIKDHNIQFAFITGDISDKGGNSSYWNMFFTKSSLAKIPFATTVGNHEYYDAGTTTVDNSIYNHYYYNPQNGPEHVKGSSYYFVYNSALFILLDSEERNYLEEQKAWFREVCSTVEASYIIVGTHRSAYAGGPYYNDGKAFIAKWGEVFDECAVDLVLSGHDHIYARTKSIYNDEVTTEKYQGTTYILGGSAGLKYYSKQNDGNVDKWAKYFDNTTCSTVIKLGKTQIRVETYNYDNDLVDSCSIDRKRFGEVDPNYTKAEFEKSFTVTADSSLVSGSIDWSEKGYGLVSTITFTNLNSDKRMGAATFLNSEATSFKVDKLFLVGEVNKIQADIIYKDGTTGTVMLELDNNINWGTIENFRVSKLRAEEITFKWDMELNPEYNYIYQLRFVNNGTVSKNVFISSLDLTKKEFTVVIDRKIEAEEIYNFEIEIINVNKNVIRTEKLTVTTPEERSDDEYYQDDMASFAIKVAIDNLLKSFQK